MTKFAALLTAALIPTLPMKAKAWDLSEIQKTLNQSSLSLNETCSGTAIAKDLVLTANHCIEQQFTDVKRKVVDSKGVVKEETVRVSIPGHILKIHHYNNSKVETSRSQIYYKVVARNVGIDLAIVKTAEPVGEAVKIGCKEPQILDKVYAIGNPLGKLFNTVTSGQVSSISRSYRDLNITNYDDPMDDGDHGFIQHTSPIAPGSSGGALYNDNGELIGVNVRGTPVGSVYLAVTTDDIVKFLNDNNVKVCGG